MTTLRAEHFPEQQVRARARLGSTSAFPPVEEYGRALFGAAPTRDPLADMRLTPPVFMPERLAKLIDLGREPMHWDVDLTTTIGGFRSTYPLYLSAFGSTEIAGSDLGLAVSAQAGALGIPMVIGENVVPVNGYRASMLDRVRAYCDRLPDGVGGVVVQQCTEDADAEVWNLLYSDPAMLSLLDSGRLAFELKVGQGAKPGLGGMTVMNHSAAAKINGQYGIDPSLSPPTGEVLRCASPGTFTEDILVQQIRLMRNNYARARTWVKLHPGRDVGQAAAVAWQSGADAVTVDGAEGGTGWAPLSVLSNVGLPLGECLLRIANTSSCLLASGGMWEGARVVKCLALGATAAGLGRAALLAADTDRESGLVRLVECLGVELQMLISALGKYSPSAVSREDVW